jgi:transcriptional regulator with XRE-family HTH domain
MPQEHQTDVASLRALRQAAGKAQADIATALRIKQPSVSKIENQLDMHLSTLRSYVEAIGGELDLIVRLPTRAPMRLHRLGDVCDTELAADRSHTAGSVPVKRDSVKRDTVKRASSRT